MPSRGGGESRTVSQQELSPEQRELINMVMPNARAYMDQDLRLPQQRVNYGRTENERQAQQTMRQGGRAVGRLGGSSIDTARGLMRQGSQGSMGAFGELLRGGRQTMRGAQRLQRGGQRLIQDAGELRRGGRQLSRNAGDIMQGGRQLVNRGANLNATGRQLFNQVNPQTQQTLGQLLRGGLRGQAGTAEGRLLSGEFMDPNSQLLRDQSRAAIHPMEQALTRRVLPGLRAGSIGNNMFGSSRGEIAEGLALSDFTQQGLDATTALQANNFDRGLGAMAGAVSDSGTRQLGAAGLGEALLGQSLAARQMGLGAQSAGLEAQGMGAGVRRAGMDLVGRGADVRRSGLDVQRGAADVRGMGLNAIQGAGSGMSNLALQSLMASPQLAQLALTPGIVNSSVAGQNRAINQARIGEQNQRFSTQQVLPFMQAQDVANLAFGMGGGSATTTSTQNPSFDPLGTAIGGGTMLALLSGMLPFSDRRIKRNLQPIFKLGSHQWYTFEFIHRPGERRLGVIAQEVQEIQPEAVFRAPGTPFLGVNYYILSVKGSSHVRTDA